MWKTEKENESSKNEFPKNSHIKKICINGTLFEYEHWRSGKSFQSIFPNNVLIYSVINWLVCKNVTVALRKTFCQNVPEKNSIFLEYEILQIIAYMNLFLKENIVEEYLLRNV